MGIWVTLCQTQAYLQCPGSWQAALPRFYTLTAADISGHRENENLHTSRRSWKLATMWSAPLAALELERIRQTRCYVAMNNSCFQPYYCCDGDAGKIAHVQTTEAKPGSRETLSDIGCQYSAHTACTLSNQHLGHEDDDGTYISTVLDVSPAPEAVAELVKCSNVVSKCRVRYSCKAHITTCTELCKCEAAE